MINEGDKVLVYRNGHLLTIGIAGPLRGFSQDQITIRYGDSYEPSWMDVNRSTGASKYHEVKSVTEKEWVDAAEKLHQGDVLKRCKEEDAMRIAHEELAIMGEKGEAWYNTLPIEQQKMIDALVWKWRPIAVA